MDSERQKEPLDVNPELQALSAQIPTFSPDDLVRYVRLITSGSVPYIDPEEAIAVRHNHMPTIEVAGMPKGLKTSTLRWIVQKLGSMGIQADFIPEPRVNIDKWKYPVEYTLAFGNKMFEALIERDKVDNEIILLDRGIFDRIAFIRAQLGNTSISSETAIAFYTGFYSKFVDGLIICTCSPDTSLGREGKRSEPGPIMEKGFLEKLEAAYNSLPYGVAIPRAEFRSLPQLDPTPFITIDSTLLEGSFAYKPTTFQHRVHVSSYDQFQDIFLRAVGTYCRLYTSGGNLAEWA